jgi:hypothetical protein
VPWVNTIKPPNNTRTISIGSNQYFLRTLKNLKNSIKNDIVKIDSSLYLPFEIF